MSPQTVGAQALNHPQLIHLDDTVEAAVRLVLESKLAALPVVDKGDHYRGIFGEREFMGALFPGYLGQLRSTAFLPRSLDQALEKRDACRHESVAAYINTEHIEVGPDFSDTQIAEIFLHHRVLVIPVVEQHKVQGLITRQGFFRTVAELFVSQA